MREERGSGLVRILDWDEGEEENHTKEGDGRFGWMGELCEDLESIDEVGLKERGGI